MKNGRHASDGGRSAGSPTAAALARRDADGYVGLRALAGYSGLSVRTLRGHLSSPAHTLPSFRVGGKVLVRRSEFDHWIQRFRSGAQAAPIDSVVDDLMREFV